MLTNQAAWRILTRNRGGGVVHSPKLIGHSGCARMGSAAATGILAANFLHEQAWSPGYVRQVLARTRISHGFRS